MVTKHNVINLTTGPSSVLAKIHMVTKLDDNKIQVPECSVLAKIHMVTKRASKWHH